MDRSLLDGCVDNGGNRLSDIAEQPQTEGVPAAGEPAGGGDDPELPRVDPGRESLATPLKWAEIARGKPETEPQEDFVEPTAVEYGGCWRCGSEFGGEAYGARCEHVLAVSGQAAPGRCRERLAATGATLLS